MGWFQFPGVFFHTTAVTHCECCSAAEVMQHNGIAGVDIIFGADLTAKVIEVNGLPSMQLGHKQGALKTNAVLTAYSQLKVNVTQDVVRIITGRPEAAQLVEVLAAAAANQKKGQTKGHTDHADDASCCIPSDGVGATHADSDMICLRADECSQMIKLLTTRANKRYFTDLWPGLVPNKEMIDVMHVTLWQRLWRSFCPSSAFSGHRTLTRTHASSLSLSLFLSRLFSLSLLPLPPLGLKESHTHTHTHRARSLSLSLFVCVCVYVSLSVSLFLSLAWSLPVCVMAKQVCVMAKQV